MFGNAVKRALVSSLPRRQSMIGGGNCTPVGKNLPEKRSVTVETGNLTDRLEILLGQPASSGAPVNERSALGVSAVLACVRLLSDMVAKLPLELYRATSKGPKLVTNHAGANLMAGIPSDLHTSFELRKLMMTSKMLGGNGYARIFRDVYGEPYSIQWIEPCVAQPQLIERNGERSVFYRVSGMTGILTRREIIHIKGESRDGYTGLSPVQLLRESIGTALSQTTAAGKLMSNGAKWPGLITVEGAPKKEQLAEIRDEINDNMAGTINAGRIPVVNSALKYTQINGMSMVDAQFIESRRFELQEIARHYGIPPFLIGDSTASTTWGTGIQEQTLGFLNFCLDPHLRGFEESLAHTLLTTEEIAKGYYFRFDRDELASVSRQDTASYFQTMRNIGVYSANDIRRKLDEPIISKEDGGDDYGRPFNASGGTPQPAAEQRTKEPISE